MTVSRALRNHSSVKEQTRKRILSAAEQLGYVRSPQMGRPGSREKQAGMFQVVAGLTGRSMSLFHSRLLISMEEHLAKRGHGCLLRTCNGDYAQFVQLLENIRSTKVDGSFLVGSFIPKQLKALQQAIPEAILLDNPGDHSIEAPHVSFAFDNEEAARLGMRHLLACNRQRILLVTGTPKHFFTEEVKIGYHKMLALHSIPQDDSLILHTKFTADHAYTELSAALSRGVTFDAVLTTDELASGVYRALLERKLKIPQDVAVCGCDGLPIGNQMFPRLTTVILNYDVMAEMAVRHILEESEQADASYRVRILPTLEVRESTMTRTNLV